MTKGICVKAPTNLKAMSGGSIPVAVLPVGGWIYGDKGLTDITGFSHYYMPDGSKVELLKECKASIGNLALTEQAEPTEPTDPPPAPTGAIYHVRKMLAPDVFDEGIYLQVIE